MSLIVGQAKKRLNLVAKQAPGKAKSARSSQEGARAAKDDKPQLIPQDTMSALFRAANITAIHRGSQAVMLWHDDVRRWSSGDMQLVSAVTEFVNREGAKEGLHYTTNYADAVSKQVHRRAVRRCRGGRGTEFDCWPGLLGLPGGKAADLQTGEVRDAVVTDQITMSTAVIPLEGETPHFDRFLWQACCEREDLYAYLWRAMGYTLAGTGEEEIAFLLRGEGGDGKGTLIGVLQDILGDYTALLQPDFFKATAERRHTTELAELDRKRLWANPESADGKWVVQRFKTLTGERALTANRMRQDPVRIALDGVLWVGVNKIPLLDGGRAMQRRLRVLPFDMRLADDEIDPRVKHELLPPEYPAILWKMIRQCSAWHEEGLLPTPDCVTAESAEFLSYSSKPLDMWFEENIEVDSVYTEKFSAIYTDCSDWHENAGHRPPTKTAVGRFLKESGYTRSRSGGSTTWSGLRLAR